ncbi:cholecystokinin receptor type A-like [Octopus sinensis]|uniref:Cholecystokinin receptor type A-like n=1 Tax=Octopus sinensis TaxID=2607531 RepID=A0A7E6FCK3_9MOLL|nr:cholecystokinin receptor type A-like [Octopus sinensis]XP_036365471.1 cholecystokinin receptor type A-like [Octopus sinensis]
MNQNNSTNVCDNIKEELEAKMLDVYFPVILYLSIFMTFGIIGNCFTFYIYCFKFEISTTQTYVVALAICDLLTCAICMPFDIALLHHPFTFHSDILCRFMVFLVAVIVISSGFIVIMIATDRYRLVCRPLGEQVTIESSKKMLVFIVVLATFVSLPMLFIHTKEKRIVKQCGNIGEICAISDSLKRTIFPFAYYVIGVMCWCSMFIGLMILYSLIAVRVGEIDKVKKHKLRQLLKFASYDEKQHGDISLDVPRFRYVRRQSLLPTQTNFIFFVITLLWVTSYVPHFISIFWKLSIENFYDNVTEEVDQINAFLLLSYYPNCAINPYIYGLCNRHFRSELGHLFRKIRAVSEK